MYYVANITLKENAEIKEGLVSLPERINEIIGIGLIPYLDYDGNEVRPGMAFNLPTISIVNPNNEVLVEKRFDDYLFFKNYNLKDVIVNKSVKTSKGYFLKVIVQDSELIILPYNIKARVYIQYK